MTCVMALRANGCASGIDPEWIFSAGYQTYRFTSAI